MANVLVKNAKVFIMNRNRRYFDKGTIAIEGSRILFWVFPPIYLRASYFYLRLMFFSLSELWLT